MGKYLFIYFFTLLCSLTNLFSNDLRARGYSLIPAPQQTYIEDGDVRIDNNWGIENLIGSKSIALNRLIVGARELHNLDFNGNGTGKISLEIIKTPLFENLNAKRLNEAYQIKILPEKVKIVANAEAGIFYGVQSLLQLLKPVHGGVFEIPIGTINDWPDTELRVIHWDTKHHQDRVGTLKKYLDWAAFFKVNAVAFEIEDKYEFPRNPVIGAPGAFTKEEMIEVTSYALDRFIQLIPLIQAPSHMTYVLKHQEFEHLKADKESNYHICMCDEDAMALIFELYQDMIDATPGVEYFFVSTDEVYYAGICGKCEKEYNVENRSQTWVDYVNRVHEWMSRRNRKMLAWVEYPLLTEHITQLSSGIIDAIMTPGRDVEWIESENKAGIKQLSYSSMQGAEYLFPNYFPTRYRNRNTQGRLKDASTSIPRILEKGGRPIGTFAAAWDDSGLHSETFWLGWATVTQYGWSIGKPSLNQNISDFMNAFYGYESPNMVKIYRLIQEGARFYEDLWDKTESTERKYSYGSSKGKHSYPRTDLILDLPALPFKENKEANSTQHTFGKKYAEKINMALELRKKNDHLLDLLSHSISKVGRNRYNLEVFISIAYLERHVMDMIVDIARAEDYLVAAEKENNPQKVVNLMIEAYNVIDGIMEEEGKMWNNLVQVWEKSRYEKGRNTEGKNFVHIMDDVKDHFADRRRGLEFMMAPIERMDLGGWQEQLWEVIKEYSNKNNVKLTGIPEERLED